MHNNGSFLVGLGNARSNQTIKRTWSFGDDVEKDEKNVKEAKKGKWITKRFSSWLIPHPLIAYMSSNLES